MFAVELTLTICDNHICVAAENTIVEHQFRGLANMFTWSLYDRYSWLCPATLRWLTQVSPGEDDD